MSEYFQTNGFRQDFQMLLKALLLISQKLEDITAELSEIKQNLNKENSAEQLVTPPNQ